LTITPYFESFPVSPVISALFPASDRVSHGYEKPVLSRAIVLVRGVSVDDIYSRQMRPSRKTFNFVFEISNTINYEGFRTWSDLICRYTTTHFLRIVFKKKKKTSGKLNAKHVCPIVIALSGNVYIIMYAYSIRRHGVVRFHVTVPANWKVDFRNIYELANNISSLFFDRFNWPTSMNAKQYLHNDLYESHCQDVSDVTIEIRRVWRILHRHELQNVTRRDVRFHVFIYTVVNLSVPFPKRRFRQPRD